jgi:hypothetical protein
MATKQQIMNSRKYSNKVDVITALLVDGKDYTEKQIKNMLKKYDEKEVH